MGPFWPVAFDLFALAALDLGASLSPSGSKFKRPARLRVMFKAGLVRAAIQVLHLYRVEALDAEPGTG